MKQQSNSLNLQIAGYLIRLSSDSPIELELGYEPFITSKTAIADVNINCYAGIPANLFQNDQLVFEAKNEEQRFYSIYRTGTDLGFIIYNQQDKDQIQQVAVLNETFSNWKVYSATQSNNKILPLKYPLGPIIMHYLTLKGDAVMMHASCAFDGTKARIFTGFSGAGKSTMSKIWNNAGSLIINDDRLIIRKQEMGYMVYNTPMYYADQPKSALLSSIHLISHSPENKTKKLNGANAVTRSMAFCIQNNFEKQFIQSRLQFFSELCLQIPVYDLGFVPDQSVINFIIANETGETK